jgi:hypothetical protein
MSKGLRRIYNVATNQDPLWFVIQQKWYLPKHHRNFRQYHVCRICGKPTQVCSNKCNKTKGRLIKECAE